MATSTSTSSSPALNVSALASSGTALVGLIVGAIVLIMVADKAPRLVNGLLALILVGLVLAHSNAYNGLLQKLTGQAK